MAQQRISKTCIHNYQLPLSRPWRSARGSVTARHGWLIVVETEYGYSGWGDCAPFPELGTETMAAAKAALDAILPMLMGLRPQAALRRLMQIDNCPPATRYGIETALADLAAQDAGIPLAKWLCSDARLAVPVNAAIGALDDDCTARVQLALAAGYRILKIKLGLQPWEEELPRLQILASTLPTPVQLRVDANQAWSEVIARTALTALTALPIEAVEEPLAEANFKILAKLQQQMPFALALDESMLTMSRHGLLAICPVQRLILKPTVLGGLSRTFALAAQAQQLGLEWVITSALESGVGVRAAAHLAAALGGDLAHGLATGTWFTQDVMADR